MGSMNRLNEDKAIIVMGDPVDGFYFIGPFDDNYDAVEYAEKWISDEWWVAKLSNSV
jgi:hypothetical protein